MELLGLLEETGPELRLELLLPQNQLAVAVGVVDLAVLGVDLGVEGQGDAVCNALDRLSGEGDLGGGNLKIGVVLGNVGNLDVHVEIVALGLISGRALSPGDWKNRIILGQLAILCSNRNELRALLHQSRKNGITS